MQNLNSIFFEQAKERVIKAINLSGVEDYLVQEVISASIPFLVAYKNPIIDMVPYRQWWGKGYYEPYATEGSTPVEWVLDTAESTEDTEAYGQSNYPFKTLLGAGKITRRAQAEGAPIFDILMESMKFRGVSAKNVIEKQMIQGTVSSTAPAGLYTLIPATQRILQSSSATGSALTEAKLEETIDKARDMGDPNMVIMSRAMKRKLHSLILSIRRSFGDIRTPGGIRVDSYDDVGIFPTTSMPDTMTFSGSAVTSLTGGTTSAIYVVSTDWFGRYYLTPITFELMAKTSSQWRKYEIYADETYVLNNWGSAAKLEGINLL